LGLAAIFGLPWSLTWPVLLTLPVGLFEIWQMIRIANGVKPAWRLMTFTSTMLVVLTAYLLTYTLWIG
jgi:1,4-dihydroxy-2-naphthoate octaprenyltransferase